MSEQAAGALASAVISGITDWALTTVMRKLRCRYRSGPAAADEKLQRLETLVLNVRCAVEVSEKHAIGSASLLERRDRLRDAAAEGEAVVLDFQRRAREQEDGEAAATSASASAPGQQQQQPASISASASASTSTLYFTRSALCGMAQRVRDVTRRLFSTDEDMKKLDGALEKMERISPDITLFLLALQLQVSPELGQRRRVARRSAPASIPAESRQQKRKSREAHVQPEVVLSSPRPRRKVTWDSLEQIPRKTEEEEEDEDNYDDESEDEVEEAACMEEEEAPAYIEKVAKAAKAAFGEEEEEEELEAAYMELEEEEDEMDMELAWPLTAEDLQNEAWALASVLEPTLRSLDGYIRATNDTNMGGLEWLAEWAAVLREAVDRGNAVLKTMCPGSDVIPEGALEVDGELYSFARVVEQLNRDEPCFAALVDLCGSTKPHVAAPQDVATMPASAQGARSLT